VVDASWTKEDVGKGCVSVHIVLILCTHVYKWKNRYLKLSQDRRLIKETEGWGEYKYDVFDIW
jgi:hypothetical protein